MLGNKMSHDPCHINLLVRVNFGGGRVVHMRSIVNMPGEALHFGTNKRELRCQRV